MFCSYSSSWPWSRLVSLLFLVVILSSCSSSWCSSSFSWCSLSSCCAHIPPRHVGPSFLRVLRRDTGGVLVFFLSSYCCCLCSPPWCWSCSSTWHFVVTRVLHRDVDHFPPFVMLLLLVFFVVMLVLLFHVVMLFLLVVMMFLLFLLVLLRIRRACSLRSCCLLFNSKGLTYLLKCSVLIFFVLIFLLF